MNPSPTGRGLPSTESTPLADVDAKGRPLYRCGTLVYTKRELIALFAWLLAMGCFMALVGAVQGAACLPRQMILFPRERYGQFCGAQALVKSGAIMVGGLLAGMALDWVKRLYPAGDLYSYRFIWVWQFAFYISALYFYYRVYRAWKRLGGIEGYVAPKVPFAYSALPKAKVSGVRKGLLIIPAIGFTGVLGVASFYVYYFTCRVPNPHNVWVFEIYSALLVLAFFVYLRLIQFMERP